jgi:DNA-binding transcriptional LysR family regulator
LSQQTHREISDEKELGIGSMEMHQVRYFLAVARALNFTRAAEECNVAQPSLTRAIRQLEQEFGGDLFRRERPHSQLTDLGRRMQPLLQQCYDSALGARSLASSVKSGEVGSLRIALSATIESALVMPYILELRKHFKYLDVKLMRGTAMQLTELMKGGNAELAIASSLDNTWDRLDTWPLFTESFVLAVGAKHNLTGCNSVHFSDLRGEVLLVRTYCEHHDELISMLQSCNFPLDSAHEVASERDLELFLEQGMGVAFVPQNALFSDRVKKIPIFGFAFRRTVSLYGVAGRQRTPVANMIMKMLRANDWSRNAT